MNESKRVVAVVFAFRESGSAKVLSLLTFDGGDEKYELPSGEAEPGDAGLREVAVRTLLAAGGRIQVPADQLIPVPFEGSYAAVYAAVLPEYPGRPMGTRWVDVTDGVLSEELAYDHGRVFDASVGAILDALVSPSVRFPCEDAAVRAMLWASLMSEERAAAWLGALGELGMSPSLQGVEKTAVELKRRMRSELEARAKALKEGGKVPGIEKGIFVYDYIHPSITVDIVVLSVNDRGELVLPLTVKDKTEYGAGMWSLPGGFVELDDYLLAGWEPGKDYRSFKSKEEYVKYVREGRSVVEVAARRLLKDKAGIVLPAGTKLYQLSCDVHDNPRHGAIDGAPIVSRAFLAVVPDYKRFENASVTSGFVKGPARWFPIHRRLFRGNNQVLEEQGQVNMDAAVGVDGKKAIQLTYDRSMSFGYLADGKLVINHFQKTDGTAPETDGKTGRELLGLTVDPGQELFAHHDDVIVDALELVKEKSFTTTILADLINLRTAPAEWNHPDNEITFDHFKKVRDAVKCFDPSVRQNLFDKETAKELKEEEVVRDLSKKGPAALRDAALRAGLEPAALEGRTRDEIIGMIIDAMAYKWMDPTGGVHRIKNNGFLVKHPSKPRTYLLSLELYQRFLDLGSTV